MRYKKYIIFLALLSIINSLLYANNGKHLTAYGELKALFLFVQFDNDSINSSDGWAYDTLTLPDWCHHFVDTNSNEYSTDFNLSQYYREMSGNKFYLIGDVYPSVIRPNHDEDYYKNIGEVNSEILQSIDSVIDFSKYDNWTVAGSGSYINKPDGIVDMVFIIYRNFTNRLFFNNGWTGSAHFYLKENIETNDGVTINKGRMSSGIQLRGGKHGFNYTVYTAAHELGHFLFGGGHIEGVTNLALMTGGPVWNASRGMHSWEKEKLGWIDFIEADSAGIKTYLLRDYMTTGDALKIPLSENEYYIIENRQKLSRHDKAGDRGLYVYHLLNRSLFNPRITVLCADGNWNFKIDSDQKRLVKHMPNPDGKSELNYSKYYKGTGYSCNKQVYTDNSAWGDSTDAFDTIYNDVLSPVSNPPIQNSAGKDFVIEVVNEDDGVYEIRVMFDDIYSGKPAKPQGFEIIKDSSDILLSWQSNKEPDINKYYIYKADTTEHYSRIDTVYGTTNNSTFTLTITDHNMYGAVSYRISAVDKSGFESVLSEKIELREKSAGEIRIINHAYK